MFGDWRPRAVVFDCDGLLVDTESCWTQAEAAMCAARGVTFSGEDEAALIGVSVPRVCRLLAARFGEGASPEAVRHELVERVADVVGHEALAMDGALALVRLARARVPVAVASNSPRALVDQALRRGGLSGLFDATVSADEVRSPKPAADVYLAACERLRVAPGDALALEDSAVGIAAAAAAGLRTIGVPSLAHADIGAQATVARLSDAPLVDWVRGWSLR